MSAIDPFPTVQKLALENGANWKGYRQAAEGTADAEQKLVQALIGAPGGDRLLNPDASIVLFGSFARREMFEGSDYDWALLIDGVVDNDHARLARIIGDAIVMAGFNSPGSSGTFGNLAFSHEMVHGIGGGADSNANLTRRMLMLLESRPFSVSPADSSDQVWENVLGNILERYFEEDVHFSPAGERSVPRFLLNDITRYWRTIAVDYAAKHWEQHGKKWAIRNAKLRFSRKLLYASGLAFCLSCQLDPPNRIHDGLFGATVDDSAGPFIERAKAFSRTPPLEYLAAFIDTYVTDAAKRKRIAERIFGSYDWWLQMIGDPGARAALESLGHANAPSDRTFQAVRANGSEFAKGLELLFFNRDRDKEDDKIAALALQYIGF